MDAREHLRTAYETFSRIGAEAFAKRARRELATTGETARRLTVETRDLLTPKEAQIARLDGNGQSNPEIGAKLFISPRTVEYHLHKVFAKFGISSRKSFAKHCPKANTVGSDVASSCPRRRDPALAARGAGATRARRRG